MQLHLCLSAFHRLYCPIIEADSSKLDVFELFKRYHRCVLRIRYLRLRWLPGGEVADGFGQVDGGGESGFRQDVVQTTPAGDGHRILTCGSKEGPGVRPFVRGELLGTLGEGVQGRQAGLILDQGRLVTQCSQLGMRQRTWEGTRTIHT